MKLFRRKNILMLVALLCFSACIKFDLHSTSHPEEGRLYLITTWNNRSEGIDIPATRVAEVGGLHLEAHGEVIERPLPLLVEGNYSLKVYAPANKISLNGDIASVETTNGYVDPSPGWFFSHIQSVEVKKDTRKHLTASMEQQVRYLGFIISVQEDEAYFIKSISAVLDGVAAQFDINNNIPVGLPYKVAVDFTPKATTFGGQPIASVHLLGIIPEVKQNLTLYLNFIDGSSTTIEKDVSSQLINFNKNKHEAMQLSTQIQFGSSGFLAEINDWVSDSENVIAK